MKTRTLVMAPLAVLLFLTAVACGDTETEYVSAPTITVAQAVVTAPDEGGTASASYTISNPVTDGEVTASASASWISDIDCSTTGSVRFAVSANANADPRTARVNISYSYTIAGTKGTATAEVTVAQSCGDQPAISVSPTAVAAALEGGSYSFEYTIVNPASDGEVSASCSASWISGIDTSTNGKVSFSVAENGNTALRSAEITLTYSWSNGSLSESVTVVQNHEPAADDDSDGSIEGTYTITGICDYSYPYSTSWTLTIHYAPDSQYTDSEYPYLIDGLINNTQGYYALGYTEYCAKAKVEGDNIIVPAQITQGLYYLDPSYTTTAYLGYVAGYLGSDGYLYAYNDLPDMVFTYDGAKDSWTCNYGIMGFLYNSLSDFNSMNGYYVDITIGDITLVKNGSGSGGDYDNYGDMTGTYSCEGYGRTSATGYDNAKWDMYITTKSDTEYYVYCLTPYAGGLDIASGGENYWASGHWGSETTFVIPSQVCLGRVNSSSATYYLGYTPCTEYDGVDFYYSYDFPDLTFTKTGDNTWESDYGVFVGGFTSMSVYSFTTYFGVTAPTIKITKTSNSVPTALSSSKPFDTAETHFNFKAALSSTSGNRIMTLRAGERTER